MGSVFIFLGEHLGWNCWLIWCLSSVWHLRISQTVSQGGCVTSQPQDARSSSFSTAPNARCGGCPTGISSLALETLELLEESIQVQVTASPPYYLGSQVRCSIFLDPGLCLEVGCLCPPCAMFVQIDRDVTRRGASCLFTCSQCEPLFWS